MNEVEKRISDTLATLDDKDPIYTRRVKVWELRVKGHSVIQIATLLDCSFGTAHADLQWCLKNLPAAYESTQDFRSITLARLDEMIEHLQENRSDAGNKTLIAAQDMQAKLLGAYAPTRIDANVKTQYEIVGVNVEEMK